MSERGEESLEHAWTRENLQKLLAAMKTCLPQRHSKHTYTVALKALNWKKVAFSPFSAEECQNKWKEILKPICKIRTLTEIITEAEDTISSLEAEEREGPPPKPPISGYNLFLHEQKQVLPNVNYVSACAKKWQSLTKEEKDSYSIRRAELQQQYARDLIEYLKPFSIKEQQRILNKYGLKRPRPPRKRATQFPGEPKMPSQSCHLVFIKDQMNLLKRKYPDAKERFTKAYQLWKELPPKEKLCYKDKVNAALQKYKSELQKWFKERTPKEQKDYLREKGYKCKYLDGNILKNHSKNWLITSDSEDEDIVISDEQEDLDSEEEDEEADDDENITFDMY